MKLVRALLLACAAVWVAIARADAQGLPSSPITVADGRLVIGGEASMSMAERDHEQYFNYTDYEHDALRLLRLGLTGAFRAGERVSFLGEIRSENLDRPIPYALFVRIRPWPNRSFDIQAGRIPPTFGAFARRSYAADQPLIGYPLAYQYLTSLRPDAVPATADDLLTRRGRGWRVRYPIGSSTADRGLPLVSAFRWDTGVQVRLGSRPVELSAAVTSGTLSNPRVDDDNGGKQLSVRLAVQPSAGLVIGGSAARGAYLSREVTRGLPPGAADQSYPQQAFGIDFEYSRGYWLTRFEMIVNTWRVPAIQAPFIDDPLGAVSVSLEGRYKVSPALYVAARADHLGFSRIYGSAYGGAEIPWDAPVSRLEVGGGYYLARNIIWKTAYQQNWRDDDYSKTRRLLAAQILYWF